MITWETILSIISLSSSLTLLIATIFYSKSNKDVDYSRSFLRFVQNPDYVQFLDEIAKSSSSKEELNAVSEIADDIPPLNLEAHVDLLNSMLYELEILLDLFKFSKKITRFLDDSVIEKMYQNDLVCMVIDDLASTKHFNTIKARITKRRLKYEKAHNKI